MFARVLNAVRWRWRCWRAVAHARAATESSLSRPGIRRVLVVCYGNIYRSPLVAELIRQRCAGTVDVRSCGFHPRPGRPSPERHVALCAARGLDLSSHRSSVMQAADATWADLIVLMDRHNWQALQLVGAPAERLAWLGALDGGPAEIPDPYGLDDESAARVLQRLEDCGKRLAIRLGPQQVSDSSD